MRKNSIFSVFALIMGFVLLVSATSCKKEKSEDATLSLSKTSLTIVEGDQFTITATYKGNDVTENATWTSSNEAIAKVSAGKIEALKASESAVTITCTYEGQSKTCSVTVIAGAASDSRLKGSDYILFAMDETTKAKIEDKVILDWRTNGEYDEGGSIVPEGADIVMQIWNIKEEIVENPNVGPNSFGLSEAWFGTASANPTPEGGWGNICGGSFMSNLNGKYSDINKITKDHVFCVALKGKYTNTATMEIGMKFNGEEKWFCKVDRNTGVNKDGDWEVFEFPATSIFDFSATVTADEFFTFMFRGAGAGTKVDIDAVFFYIPAK